MMRRILVRRNKVESVGFATVEQQKWSSNGQMMLNRLETILEFESERASCKYVQMIEVG